MDNLLPATGTTLVEYPVTTVIWTAAIKPTRSKRKAKGPHFIRYYDWQQQKVGSVPGTAGK